VDCFIFLSLRSHLHWLLVTSCIKYKFETVAVLQQHPSLVDVSSAVLHLWIVIVISLLKMALGFIIAPKLSKRLALFVALVIMLQSGAVIFSAYHCLSLSVSYGLTR